MIVGYGDLVNSSSWRAIVWAVARRPLLWPTAIRQGWGLRRRRWWMHAPFLPLPDRKYVRFRSVTAYGGDGETIPTAADVIMWLSWCRDWHVTR